MSANGASPSAQVHDDWDGLLAEVLPFAQQQLKISGAFAPFGAGVPGLGAISSIRPELSSRVVAGTHATLEALYDGARAATGLRAAALVTDVKEGTARHVRVDLEHSEGFVMTVVTRYTRSRAWRSVRYGQARVEQGSPHVWRIA